jgi:hypothetical protein
VVIGAIELHAPGGSQRRATSTDVALAGAQSTATAGVFELEVTPADVFVHTYAADSATGRGATAVKNRRIPDPDTTLFVEIRVRNTATAASSTTLTLDSVLVEDIEELTAEITGGRGGVAKANGLPVATVGGTVDTVTTVGTVTRAGTVANLASVYASTANLAASAVYTGPTIDLGASPNVDRLRAFAFADQPGSLWFEVSIDATTWRALAPVVANGANNGITTDVPAVLRYARVKYQNTGAATTTVLGVATATVAG